MPINLNELYGEPHQTMTAVVSYLGDYMTIKQSKLFANLPADVEAGDVIDASGALVGSASTEAFVVLEPFVSAGENKFVVVHAKGAAGIFFKYEGLRADDMVKAIELLQAQDGVQVMTTKDIYTT